MDAKKLVCLTRLSIGSLGLTDPAARAALARGIRQLRRAQRALWESHGLPCTYRIFSE